jgi:galactokinase
VRRERAGAFAPGRVNLIGEHTDYNRGLALAFAITEGVTVRGKRTDGRSVHARALDLGEEDTFAIADRSPAEGWRAFVRGAVAELCQAGASPAGVELEISGGVPRGSGLSSSAALEVALCLVLLALADTPPASVDRIEIARLCARVEGEWVGAHTGLLDQLASLYGQLDKAVCIDFRTLDIEPVELRLEDWRLVVVDSGERHAHASSGYNQRRAECGRASELLGVQSLREADWASIQELPQPLRNRARHVLSENGRVRDTLAALAARQFSAVGDLLRASHESLREHYEVSTPAVEATVKRLTSAGAAGARLMGGGFGGSVLGLFAPGVRPPADAREVAPGAGAHLLRV